MMENLSEDLNSAKNDGNQDRREKEMESQTNANESGIGADLSVNLNDVSKSLDGDDVMEISHNAGTLLSSSNMNNCSSSGVYAGNHTTSPSVLDQGVCSMSAQPATVSPDHSKSEQSLLLSGLKKDDSGIYSERSPVGGGVNSKDCSDVDISESFDDSGATFSGDHVHSDFMTEGEEVSTRQEINTCDDNEEDNLVRRADNSCANTDSNSQLPNIPEPASYNPVHDLAEMNCSLMTDSHNTLDNSKPQKSESSSLEINDSESNQSGSQVTENDGVSKSDTADCDNDDSTAESETFRRIVNRSKFHKRQRPLSSSSDSDSSDESDTGLGRIRRSYRLDSDDNEDEDNDEKKRKEKNEDDSDNSDESKDKLKSASEDEDNDTAIGAGFGSPKHKYRALFDIRSREYGYAKTVPPQFFRQKVQGSLQMVQRFELQYKMEYHEGCVNALHFNRIGTLLASGSDDLNIVLWNWIRQRPALVYDSGHRSNVFQAKFMPFSGDCHVVSCARDGQVRLADLSLTGVCKGTKKLAQHKGAAHKLALEYDSPHIFLSCGEDAVTFEIDLRQEKPNKLVTTKENERKVAMYSIQSNPNNAFEFCLGGRDHFIRIYDKRKIAEEENDGVLKKFCPQHLIGSDVKANVTCACYNFDGTEVLGTFNDEDIYLFDNTHSDGAQHIHRYTGHRNNQTVKGVNFYGPRSEFIVSGSDCGHIFLWDKETEKIVQFMEGDDGGVINVLEPHPFMPLLATSGLDHDVKIWAPTAEKPTDLKGLKKIIRQNKREREEERSGASDMIDGQMLWFIMHHLRRPRRRRPRQEDEGGARDEDDDDDDDDDSDSDSNDSPTLSENSEEGGAVPERISCNPS